MEKLVERLLELKTEEFLKQKKICKDFVKLERLITEIGLLETLLLSTGHKEKDWWL